MSTYDENVRSYESFARGSLEASPGTGSVEELPLTREEPETPPSTPPPKQQTTPTTPGFAETAPTLALRRSSASSAVRDAFTRSSEALAVVDEARREAAAPRFVEAGPRRRRYEGEEY